MYIYNHAFSTSARHADCLRRDCSWTCCSLFCICFSLSFTVFTVCFFEWFIFPYTFNGSSVYLSLPKKKIRLFIRRSTSIVVNGKNVSSKKTIRDFDFGNKQKSSFFFREPFTAAHGRAPHVLSPPPPRGKSTRNYHAEHTRHTVPSPCTEPGRPAGRSYINGRVVLFSLHGGFTPR